MDRSKIILLWLPIFLFCSDIVTLFTPQPPQPPKPVAPQHLYHQHQHVPPTQPHLQQSLEFPAQKPTTIGANGVGNTVNIDFCTSCSYRGTAVTMKNMLETMYPGITVILGNYPPPLPKRLLAKVVPVVQFGVIGTIVAGEHIFPRLGIMTPPPWYYSLRSNKFGSIASTWLLGNFIQSFLQSSGAFEVYCNGELIFSKLKEQRFPGEIELKDLVGQRIAGSRFVNGAESARWP